MDTLLHGFPVTGFQDGKVQLVNGAGSVEPPVGADCQGCGEYDQQGPAVG